MGHLFRMLRFASFLRERGEQVVFYLNNHPPAITVLQESTFDCRVVDLCDFKSNWERELIRGDGVAVWVNDRLDTDRQHALHVKGENIKLITLDDRGSGAEHADLNVAALVFEHREKLQGGRVLFGAQYLILDRTIDLHHRERTKVEKVLITMGGSDTYGVTLQVVQHLREIPLAVTIVVGPGFVHLERLRRIVPTHFDVRVNVPSLIELFADFDLAFTAGGVTPFEACASGLPCIVTATENFEIPVGQYLERMGGALFAGYRKGACYPEIPSTERIAEMSRNAASTVDTRGVERVYAEVLAL